MSSGEVKQLPLRGLNYSGNSCYQDVIYFILFANQNNIIDTAFFKKQFDASKDLWIQCHEDIKVDVRRKTRIQLWLHEIMETIRNVDEPPRILTCFRMRRLFYGCLSKLGDFHLKIPLSAGEFMGYLFNIFHFDVASVEIQNFGRKDLDGKWEQIEDPKIDNHCSPLWQITHHDLKGRNPIVLSDLLSITDTFIYEEVVNGYYARKVIRSIRSNIIIFFLRRNTGSDYVPNTIDTPVYPELKIGELCLTGIVCHHMNHYTCFVLFQPTNTWYYYDDGPSSGRATIREVLFFELKTAFKCAELFLYTK